MYVKAKIKEHFSLKQNNYAVVLKLLITFAIMAKTKEITPLQYANYLGCTSQNISKHLRKGKMQYLPDVLEVKRYSRFYLLVVSSSLPID